MRPNRSESLTPYNFHRLLLTVAAATLLPVAAQAQKKSKPPARETKPAPPAAVEPAKPAASALEPICALVEPAVMRNELARSFARGRSTVILPAKEDADSTTAMSAEEFAATGLTWEQFLAKATAAGTRVLAGVKPEIVRTSKGDIAYAVLRSERHILPSVLLSPAFPKQFAKDFGDRLIVVMPDHFTLYVFSRNFGDFQGFGPRVLQEFESAVWPCSYEVFEITSAGVKCIGSYSPGADDPSGESPAAPSEKPVPPAKPKK